MGDLSQLVHLADAIEHYQEHKKNADAKEKEFCFIEFFVVHYLAPNSHEEDHDAEHDKLPLQQINTHIIYDIVDHSIDMLEICSIDIYHSSPIHINHIHSTEVITKDIQPPRHS